LGNKGNVNEALREFIVSAIVRLAAASKNVCQDIVEEPTTAQAKEEVNHS
jgi:hypothetical protein